MSNKKVFFVLPLLVFFFSALQADAATISLLPQARMFGIGQEFSVDIKINTEEAFINASQVTIRFPVDMLELTNVDKTGSAFGFWPNEPKISNEEGTLTFTGGTAKGIAGESLQILKMKFKAKGAGFADLNIVDAAITASDGKGTNVLSQLKGTNVTIGTTVVAPEKSSSAPQAPVVAPPVEAPKKIIREPVLAKKLPLRPELRVPLYPDETRWYNHLGETAVFWNVPEDVIEVASVIDKSPTTKPQKPEQELFTGKNFGVLKEGVWYIHVRFRNNIGWGETAHYKISIDTTAPLPFEIKTDQIASDNPTPEVRYEAHDILSGISHALLFIDGKEFLKSTTTVSTLSPQAPGKHTLLVRVFDLAGNSVESDLAFEILPLPTPTIEFISRSVSQGELIFASGKSIPNTFIDARVSNTSRQEVFKGTASSDLAGNWKIIIDKPLPTGKYTVSVVARDERGATSFSTKEESFKVRPKTILSLGFIDLGWFEILLIAMIIITLGAGLAAWRYVSQKNTRGAYKIIVGRDIEKLSTLLSGHLKELEGLQELHDPSRSTQATALIEKMKEVVAKMKKYLGEEVSKLK